MSMSVGATNSGVLYAHPSDDVKPDANAALEATPSHPAETADPSDLRGGQQPWTDRSPAEPRPQIDLPDVDRPRTLNTPFLDGQQPGNQYEGIKLQAFPSPSAPWLMNFNAPAAAPAAAPQNTPPFAAAAAPASAGASPNGTHVQTPPEFASRVKPGALPNTQGLNTEAKFKLYSSVLNQAGNEQIKQDLESGKKVVLSLRVDTGSMANAGQGKYDDRMVVMWKDANGTPQVHEFVANVDPSSRYEDGRTGISKASHMDGNDFNGDGRKDLGRLSDGTYAFTNGPNSQFLNHRAMKATNDQVVQRYTAHDQSGTPNLDAVQTGNYGMHVHIGGANITGSSGCMTLSPTEHQRFFEKVGSSQSVVRATVVNTDRLGH